MGLYGHPLCKTIHVQFPLKIARPIRQPFSNPPSPSAIRDELERLVLLDLLGPAGGPEEEVEDSSVRDRYLVGALRTQ